MVHKSRKYTSSIGTSEFQKKYISIESLLQVILQCLKIKFRKSTSSILLNSKINTSILKVYFKYTYKFEKKYINLKNLLPVNFWV